tara:strand:+ start:221 stop:403 length:183 start_codon:yes stop_codon:yes gene_type:complete
MMNTLRILSKIQDLKNDLCWVKYNEINEKPHNKDESKYWELAKIEHESKIKVLMEILQNE